jgi:prolipoprotein diacylglyceryl transferase
VTPAFIPSPSSNGLRLGPLFLHAYGLAYVFAVAAAVLITRRRWRRAGGDPDLVYEVALWAFPAGLIGGRLYFLITTPSQVPAHWWGPFAVWKGGLGLWGGIACGAAVGIWVLRRRLDRDGVRRFMDAAAPALLVSQAIGRLGNYFNQELFGGPTSLPWGLKIDLAHRPPGYEHFATFHPTFLYELVFDLALAAALVWLGNHRRIKPPGLFALYVAGYSGFRAYVETLRIDYANHILGLRLNFFVAALLCVTGLAWFAHVQWGLRLPRPGRRARRGAGIVGVAWLIAWAAGCGGAGGPAGAQRRAYVPTRVAIANWALFTGASAEKPGPRPLGPASALNVIT